MILSVEELDMHPEMPTQWQRYYNRLSDEIFMQVRETTDVAYPEWVSIEKGAAVRDSMRISGTLTRSKYSAKDYQTYLDQIVATIAGKYGDTFNDFMSSEPAIMIVEYISAALDQMSWYHDRESDEFYLSLAKLTSNIAHNAKYLGYKASPAVSGTTDIDITLPSGPYGFDVPIEKGHKVLGPNRLTFEVDTNYVIPAGLTTKRVTVYQGESFTEVFLSDGSPKQVFNLSLLPADTHLAEKKSVCKISGTPWDEEEFLPYGEENVFEINYLNDPPQLRFGDGIIGAIPPEGAEIRITYIATAGKVSMEAISNTIQTNVTSVVVNFETIPIEVNNPFGVSGASDPETNDSIIANAPRYFDAADRLVTARDIKTLAEKFSDPLYGKVSRANATAIRGVQQDLQLETLLGNIVSGADEIDSTCDLIIENQDAIDGITGSVGVDGTVLNNLDLIATENSTVRGYVSDIGSLVTASKVIVDAANAHIANASNRAKYVGSQQVVGYGDGSTVSFSTTITKIPIQKNTVAVIIDDRGAVEAYATDGDCDTEAGTLYSATIGGGATTFIGSEGKTVKIKGEYRQVIEVLGVNAIRYSGPRIYGTGLRVELLAGVTIGYDNGAGAITGTGIASGSVNYTSGALSVEYVSAPSGVSGKYGTAIVVTFQYEDEAITGYLDSASTSCEDANTSIDGFDTIGTSITASADNSDSVISDIQTNITNIGDWTQGTRLLSEHVKTIPVQMREDITTLESYLDEVISGECKANIIRVALLVLDSNGFYTAPSQSLLNAAQTYMDARRIETVRYSIVSGSYYLLLVSMTIQVKVSEQYTFNDVSERILIAANSLLKGRDYGGDMPRKEYYDILDVEGVSVINIEISNTVWDINETSGLTVNPTTPPEPDENGNLFIGDDAIISKGEITITEIV